MTDSLVQAHFIVKNDRGIHTRPATEIVRCALTFKSDIRLKYKNHEVSAKSLLGILTLAAVKGAEITIEARGGDAQAAVAGILKLANENFNISY